MFVLGLLDHGSSKWPIGVETAKSRIRGEFTRRGAEDSRGTP
jgi:hypothetical protein